MITQSPSKRSFAPSQQEINNKSTPGYKTLPKATLRSSQFESIVLSQDQIEIERLETQLVALKAKLVCQDENETEIYRLKDNLKNVEDVRLKQEHVIHSLQIENRSLRQINSKLQQERESMAQELTSASQYILQLEEKCYQSNKTALEILTQLKDTELEVEALKQYIIDLKGRIAVYIPVKEDSTDLRLAEYINNFPDRQKLKIMFLRESEGVYLFGSRRIAVRVDNDKINIRVGGGYLSIDEFLDQYTPQELEKMQRNDPLKRFNEKVAVQKTLTGNQVIETAPIQRSITGSPYLKKRV